MKTIESFIYDVYTYTACLFLFDEEYEHVCNSILEYAKTTNNPCDIYIDACKKKFTDHETIVDDIFENIHIIVSGKGISKVDKIIKKALSKNSFYKKAYKFSIDDEQLLSSHKNFLENNAFCLNKINVSIRDEKKLLFVARHEIVAA